MQIGKFTLIDSLTYGLRNQLVNVSGEGHKVSDVNDKLLEIGIVSVDGKTSKQEIMEIVNDTDIEVIDEVLEYMIGLIGKKKKLTLQE